MLREIEPQSQVAHDFLYEVVDGERRELEPAGVLQSLVASRLCRWLGNWADENKLGMVVTQMLFLLDEARNLQRRPDVAFVSYSSWQEQTLDDSDSWNVVPELAIEVVGPRDMADEIDCKLTDYFNSGVRLAWVIHPESRHVYVYAHDARRAVQRLESSDSLNGGDVLPGFELEIDALFASPRRRN